VPPFPPYHPYACSGTLLPGDRVLLVYLPSLDFIVAFLACFRAGLVPVPVYPPDPRRSRAYISAFSQIAEDCGAKAALSHADYLRAVSLAGLAETAKRLFSFGRSSKGGAGGAGKADWPELTWINTTELLASASGSPPAGAAAAPAPTPAPADAAFLQYTSGSTADPKGVIVTHACLQHNLTAIMAALEADQSTVVVSWLPQYHDMGLIGALQSASCLRVASSGRVHASSVACRGHVQGTRSVVAFIGRELQRVQGSARTRRRIGSWACNRVPGSHWYQAAAVAPGAVAGPFCA